MKTFFISYNGALEPLIQSQGIPYLEGLSQKGVGCVLLTFEKPPTNSLHFNDAIKKLKTELRRKNIEWYYLRYHKWPTLPATLFDILCGIMVSIYLIIFKKVDIVHSRAAVAGVIGYIAARITMKKFLLDERGLMAEEYADGNMWKRGGVFYNATLGIEKWLLRRSDAVVVLTENIRDYLLTSPYLYPLSQEKKREITVIPCCVDLTRFNIAVAPDPRIRSEHHLEDKWVIVYSGSLGTWYLLKEMIDFFACAKTVIRNAHFLFLTHSDSSGIGGVWRENGLSPDDLTIKSAAYDHMPGLMRSADCGIFFIKPVFSKRSSCPIKFAEYLACGLPVVLNSGIGDMDTIVERNKVGVIARGFNRQEYLSCVQQLQGLMKERDFLRNKCYNTTKSLFRLELGVEKYAEVYRTLLKEGS